MLIDGCPPDLWDPFSAYISTYVGKLGPLLVAFIELVSGRQDDVAEKLGRAAKKSEPAAQASQQLKSGGRAPARPVGNEAGRYASGLRSQSTF